MFLQEDFDFLCIFSCVSIFINNTGCLSKRKKLLFFTILFFHCILTKPMVPLHEKL